MPNASSWGGFGDASINAGTQSVLTAYDSPGLPGLSVPPLNQVVFLFSTSERYIAFTSSHVRYSRQHGDQHAAVAGPFSI